MSTAYQQGLLDGLESPIAFFRELFEDGKSIEELLSFYNSIVIKSHEAHQAITSERMVSEEQIINQSVEDILQTIRKGEF